MSETLAALEACRLLDGSATARPEGDCLTVKSHSEGLLRKRVRQIETEAYNKGSYASRETGHGDLRRSENLCQQPSHSQNQDRSQHQSQEKAFRSCTREEGKDPNDKQDATELCVGGCFLHPSHESGRCPVCYCRNKVCPILPGHCSKQASRGKEDQSCVGGCFQHPPPGSGRCPFCYLRKGLCYTLPGSCSGGRQAGDESSRSGNRKRPKDDGFQVWIGDTVVHGF